MFGLTFFFSKKNFIRRGTVDEGAVYLNAFSIYDLTLEIFESLIGRVQYEPSIYMYSAHST